MAPSISCFPGTHEELYVKVLLMCKIQVRPPQIFQVNSMIITPLFVAHKFDDLDNKKNLIRSSDPIHLNRCKLQDDP